MLFLFPRWTLNDLKCLILNKKWAKLYIKRTVFACDYNKLSLLRARLLQIVFSLSLRKIFGNISVTSYSTSPFLVLFIMMVSQLPIVLSALLFSLIIFLLFLIISIQLILLTIQLGYHSLYLLIIRKAIIVCFPPTNFLQF